MKRSLSMLISVDWDTSSVTNMSEMFRYATSFNQDIGVGYIFCNRYGSMFRNASSFNGDISGWDTSLVTDMSLMFNNASFFNSNISSWDISSLTNTNYMFYSADAFCQDLSSWTNQKSGILNNSEYNECSSSFTNNNSLDDNNFIDACQYYCSNPTGTAETYGDISDWDTSQVTDMTRAFANCTDFNEDISGWDVSNVTSMKGMFRNASSFNQDISEWDTSSVEYMNGMFYWCILF